ncbi:MAG TPA: hypothetical protein DCR61_11540 [Verrucomicrobiales bacterium]|nr:hypothetical protein [Pedosphaera sp.]HAQ99975.1 hypothetical protein [Verrucomicrobiales bacterium]HBP57145.1 hypothetical protein [Verrucomicrobiales bacterium]HCZ03170.1 hypothetical protein [Verrucomicrobiales bacterium]|tara:strand:+ start:348 stop:584 length:237 start_codon:yes stop_codon:yes gene_type:complete
MVLFALHAKIFLGPLEAVKPEADKIYLQMLQSPVTIGLRGLFLTEPFGAIQSTVNSTSTIVTLDIYKRIFRPGPPIWM